ncbi:MAG: hypothetical protein K9G26_10265 [Emcibacter sp.]|nr:hypothetical protein [Emcibacter sp.]
MVREKELSFTIDEHIVYPKHGVGVITEICEQEISGMKLDLYVIRFESEKMTLRVPINKAIASGMRSLSSPIIMDKAYSTLKGRARVKRTMWSRRAQEYEAKINSGNLVHLAEVVRDLHRGGDQTEQSYSERQIYESAISRLAREVAAIEEIAEKDAMLKLADVLTAA